MRAAGHFFIYKPGLETNEVDVHEYWFDVQGISEGMSKRRKRKHSFEHFSFCSSYPGIALV